MEAQIVSDKMVQIERLLELIQGINKLLTLHRSLEKPNQMAIADYEELRKQYINELTELLKEYDITISAAHSEAT
ncbi:hypothetical protein BH09BAC4_BH09BAC4_20620 [soil metagenome]